MAGRTAVGLTLVALAAAGLWIDEATARGPASGTVEGRVTVASGRVIFTGSTPAGEEVDMSADPYCREQHDAPVVARAIRVGEAGGLADVLIHVKNAPGGAAEASDGALLDQIGCLYTPGVIAVRTGQDLTIRNSDATLHNVRVTPQMNRGFNLGQPLAGLESERSFPEAELGIPVRCDIHGWMGATVHVLDHGFFAVSAEDGSFSLPALPAGQYEIEAWHPTLGASSQTITVAAGETATVSFELSG